MHEDTLSPSNLYINIETRKYRRKGGRRKAIILLIQASEEKQVLSPKNERNCEKGKKRK